MLKLSYGALLNFTEDIRVEDAQVLSSNKFIETVKNGGSDSVTYGTETKSLDEWRIDPHLIHLFEDQFIYVIFIYGTYLHDVNGNRLIVDSYDKAKALVKLISDSKNAKILQVPLDLRNLRVL